MKDVGRLIGVLVENMCYGTEHNEYPIRLVAQIPMQDNMNTENLLTNAYNEFQKIVDEIVQSDIVVLEEYSNRKRNMMKTLMLRIYTLPAHENITYPCLI